jgi:hypothetical protein
VAVQPEQRIGGGKADQRRFVEGGRKRHRPQDPDHGEVPAAQVHLGGRAYLADAEGLGRDRAEHHGGVPGGGRVQERAGSQALLISGLISGAQRAEQPGLGGVHRDAAVVDGGYGRGPADDHAPHVADGGHRLDRRDARDHRLGGQRQVRGRAVEVLPGGDRDQVALGAELGEQVGPG